MTATLSAGSDKAGTDGRIPVGDGAMWWVSSSPTNEALKSELQETAPSVAANDPRSSLDSLDRTQRQIGSLLFILTAPSPPTLLLHSHHLHPSLGHHPLSLIKQQHHHELLPRPEKSDAPNRRDERQGR